VLKAINVHLNKERKKDGLPAVEPCEALDLIGVPALEGSIIAIRLSRLEMDADECISAYRN
ncbi:hypothetical protein GQ43DRAFT_377653, partial [Delitschia confertaspora ATCC 74209]